MFGKPPFCQKIQSLLQKSNSFPYCLSVKDLSDEDCNSLITLDSVIIFTCSLLSRICCIGALFQSKVRTQTEDTKIKFLQNLLYTEHLQDANIPQLNPLLKDNFSDCDLDMVKACCISTLLIVRTKTVNINIKCAVEIAEDILASSGRTVLDKDDAAANKGCIEVLALKIRKNPYCAGYYIARALLYAMTKEKSKIALDLYTFLIFNPSCLILSELCEVLKCKSLFKELIEITAFALASCSSRICDSCKALNNLMENSEHNLMNGGEVYYGALELKSDTDDNKKKMAETTDNFPDLIDASDSDEEIVEDEVQLCVVNETNSDCALLQIQTESEYIPENIPELIEASDSDETYTEKSIELSQEAIISSNNSTDQSRKVNSSVEELGICVKAVENVNKQHATSKKKKSDMDEYKKTLLKGQQSVLKECNTDVIHNYLKESYDALIKECGYKALQLFCGPLKEVVENPEEFGLGEEKVVCIKYCHGLAYCQSGGYDDLQKCIVIFKGILEKHDSVVFPAAYYYLGLAHRKLNRFKDALSYLESVKSILDKGIHCKSYCWPAWHCPGPLIEETRPKVLKGLVENLIKECENPPNPDATCRFPGCNLQPTIYYSDPAFKGYISTACSEQCFLQYHIQCWKQLKSQKEFTDKAFLEYPCFTPDCDGLIIKVQFVDKKGDIHKEFTTDLKKETRTKWAKCENKVDIKEKKKKKSCKSETSGFSSESDKVFSKNSCGNEAVVSFAESSEYFVVCQDKITVKNEISHANKMVKKVSSTHSNPAYTENLNEINSLDDCESQNMQLKEEDANYYNTENSDLLVSHCIKNNIYSYMVDLLQLHGPLKIDDPFLLNEISSFPDDACSIISECGGITEFLKNDLRFACVRDVYICVVSDLAKAYKMYSNSFLCSDIKSINTFENTGYYHDDIIENFALNPNATEYRPSIHIDENVECDFSNGNSLSQNLHNFSVVSERSVCNNNNVKISDIPYNNVSNNLNNSINISKFHESNSNCNGAKEKLCGAFETDEKFLNSKLLSLSDSSMNRKVFKVSENVVDKNKALMFGKHFASMLNEYFSENMQKYHKDIESYIKLYSIKKSAELEFPEKDSENKIQTLNVALTEQNTLLQKQLNSTKMLNQQISNEVLKLNTDLKEMTSKLEEYSKKNEELQNSQKSLLVSLTTAHEAIDRQKKEIDLIHSDKNSAEIELKCLKSSLQTCEEELKNSVAKEKKYVSLLQNLEQENLTLKRKLQQTELHFLYEKKSEYLKKIEAKSFEAKQKRKELMDDLSLIHGNLQPVMETSTKTLSAHLLAYINDLAAIKVDIMLKFDNQLEKINKGASLSELEDINIELGPIPCWKSLFPVATPGINKFIQDSTQPPLNFGINYENPAVSMPIAVSSSKALTASTNAIAVSLPVTPILPSTVPVATIGKEPLQMLNCNLNLQKSYKTSIGSINSVANAPLSDSCHSLDEDIQKNSVISKASTTLLNSKIDTTSKVPVEHEKKKLAIPIKNNYEKLLTKLQIRYPSYTLEELMAFVKDFRSQRQGKLTGLPIEAIITQIGEIINAKKTSGTRNPMKLNKILVNKKLHGGHESKKAEKQEIPVQKMKCAWNISSDRYRQWSGTNSETSCSICFEDYEIIKGYKVTCGHIFHEHCIREWLQNQSHCPICRLHVLLPEDYPPL